MDNEGQEQYDKGYKAGLAQEHLALNIEIRSLEEKIAELRCEAEMERRLKEEDRDIK